MNRISKEFANLYRNTNGTYVFRKAIPQQYRELARKREFKFSLKTKDLVVAVERFTTAKQTVDALIQDLKHGKSFKETIRFEEASALAEAQGRQLRPLEKLLEDTSELIAAHAGWKSAGKATPELFKSYFNADMGDIKVSELVGFFERDQAHVLNGLNESDRKKKLAPLKLACKDLTKHLKQDRMLLDISNGDANSFEDELKQRIANHVIKPNTANKRLVALRVLMKTYYRAKGVKGKNIQTPFDDMKFKEKRHKRSAFSVEFVRRKWLNENPLQNLNTDARNLLLAMLDTGCGLKELCGLDPRKDIKLDADIPHIVISANANRTLKTEFRDRKIPLIGYALIAFKNCPKGFLRYAGPNGHTSASAAINKFLKSNGLDENGDCTANGLRHLFKDRLREHGIASELQDRLMGHQTPGMSPEYGKGFSLSSLQAAMKQIEADFAAT